MAPIRAPLASGRLIEYTICVCVRVDACTRVDVCVHVEFGCSSQVIDSPLGLPRDPRVFGCSPQVADSPPGLPWDPRVMGRIKDGGSRGRVKVPSCKEGCDAGSPED